MTNPKVLETMARAMESWIHHPPMRLTVAEDIRQALQEAGYVVEKGWRPIATAPKDGSVRIVSPDPREEYAWRSARWAQDTVLGGRVLTGWWEDGIWLVEQPTHWFDVPTCPVSTFLEQGDQDQVSSVAESGGSPPEAAKSDSAEGH